MRHFLYSCLLLCLLACATTAHAQTCCDKLRSAGIESYDKGNYADAIKKWEAAKTCATKCATNDLDSKIKEAKVRLNPPTKLKVVTPPRKKAIIPKSNGVSAEDQRKPEEAIQKEEVQKADEATWKFAQRMNSEVAYKTYLEDYPQGKYISQAKEKVKNLEEQSRQQIEENDWNVATNINTSESYQKYIDKYKNGKYNTQAKDNILELNKPASIDIKLRQFFEPEIVWVEKGKFNMGSEHKYGNINAEPIHEVTIKDFYIGKFEVTTTQYGIFLNEKIALGVDIKKWINIEKEASFIKLEEKKFIIRSNYENHPITQVNWFGAVAYAQWLSEKTGKKYRLPTEAEWEYAAKGGKMSSDLKFSGGDIVGVRSWYAGNAGYETHSIGQRLPNKLEIYDMSGNVFEWVQDCMNLNYNFSPIDGSSFTIGPSNKGNCRERIIRGGSIRTSENLCRVSSRSSFEAVKSDKDIGFRIVVEL